MHHLSHVPAGFSTYTHFFHKLVHQKEKSYPQIFYKKTVFERRFSLRKGLISRKSRKLSTIPPSLLLLLIILFIT